MHVRRSLLLGITTLILAALAVGGSSAEVLRVPEEFASIQQAVDAAAPHDTIEVGPGEFAGAYIYRPVQIVGSGPQTRITAGNDYRFWPGEDVFDIFGQDAWPGFCEDSTCAGDGTVIRNLAIDGSEGSFYWGIFFEADDVRLEDIRITGTPWSVYGLRSERAQVSDLEIFDSFRGITSEYGNDWTIRDNLIVGAEIFPLSWNKHAAMVLIAGHGTGHLIDSNVIFHEGDAVCTGKPGSFCGPGDGEGYYGIDLIAWSGPMESNVVVDNDVVILVAGVGEQAALVLADLPAIDGWPPLIRNNTVRDNHLVGGIDLAPPELSELNLLIDND